MSIRAILCRSAAAAAIAVWLAGCATPADVKTGESASAVITRLGAPTVQRARPEGGERLIWSTQPMGQFAWVSDVGPDGKVIRTFQTLTSERFDMLNQGTWTTDRLLYEFGPPADISRVGLRGEHIVWEYRFRQDGVWNSMMYVYVNAQGVVTRHHPGPDPMMEVRFQMGR